MLKALIAVLRNPDRDDEQHALLGAAIGALGGVIGGIVRGGDDWWWRACLYAFGGAGLILVFNTLNLARSAKWLRRDLLALSDRVQQLERRQGLGRSPTSNEEEQ